MDDGEARVRPIALAIGYCRAMPVATSPAVSLEQVRRLWCYKQRIANAKGTGPRAVLASTGWARTLGGIDVYLSLRSRNNGMTKTMVDGDVANGNIRVVPAVRGCIYLAPSDDAELLLSLARELAHKKTARDLDKTGVRQGEVDELAKAIARVVATGPKTTAEVRKALPKGSIRSLGDIGKKVGLSSPLPVALRQLEFSGKLVRTPIADSLDTEVYRWSVPKPVPRRFGLKPVDCYQQVTERFLNWFGPATVKHMADWIGVPQRAIKQALEQLPTRELTIEGHAKQAVLLDQDYALLTDVPAPKHIAFLPFGDNVIHLHGGPAAMIDPAYHDLEVRVWGGRGRRTTIGTCNHLGYRSILVGDKVVGFWEYDPQADEVVTCYFGGSPPRGSKTALKRALDELHTAICHELGHARSFSLDTDDGLHQRANELRKLGG